MEQLPGLKAELEIYTIMVGNFSTPHAAMDRLSIQKIHKEIWGLNYTLYQKDLTGIYVMFHPIETHGTFSTLHCPMLGHQKSLNVFKTEIISKYLF